MVSAKIEDRFGRIRRRALLVGGAALVASPLALGSAFSKPSAARSGTPGFSAVVAAVNLRRTPGVSAAAVFADGRIRTAVAGTRDLTTGRPMTPSTRLMSGSTGKTFCAATTLSLRDSGVVDLDAPLAPIFRNESWYARLPNASALTLRMLLQHGGGFPQFLALPAFQWAYLADSLSGADTAYSPRRMLGFILDTEPLNAPGAAHSYSDLHYHLVGLTLERVTGRSYWDLLAERVLSRLPNEDILPAVRRDLPGLAAGYARGDLLSALASRTGRTLDRQGHLRQDPSLEYTGGGLAVTPRALADFFARLASGRIVSKETFSEMVSSSLPVNVLGQGVTSAYGLGVYITRRPVLGRYVSHSGYYPGYTSNVAYMLDHGFAVAVQQNTDHGPDINDLLRSLASGVLSDQAQGIAV